jgi:MFS transporter, DHA1 family, inner membrane transport protein
MRSGETAPNANRILFFVALGLFGLYTVEFGIVGVLPQIVDRFHVSVSKAGWLVAVFAFIVALCGPPVTIWSSRFDRRKILAGTPIGFACCSALSAFAPNYPVLMALRIPTALMHPIFFAAAFATAVSLFPAERAEHATAMAFVGTSMGMVLGVPLTTWIGTTVSLQASFLFCAAVNLVAGVALVVMVPSTAPKGKTAGGNTWAVLRRPAVLLAVAMTIFVFASGFSVYSYAAEYLSREIGLRGRAVGLLLLVFGCGGVIGNLIGGRLLGHHRIATVIGYPMVLAISYLVLLLSGTASLAVMVPVCLFWGAAHTAGLVVTQIWMISAAPDEREFATSLYLAAANVGVLIGAATGGVFIDRFGLPGILWSGWIWAALALAVVLVRLKVAPPQAKG